MSYCRWSSDDYLCDVYCYEDVSGGYSTWVAGNRPVYKEPLPPKVSHADDFDGRLKRIERVRQMLDEADREDIGLSHDGAYFNDPTAWKTAVRLRWLRMLGYSVPQRAIDALREEADGGGCHERGQ